jgi:hypothetical protein
MQNPSGICFGTPASPHLTFARIVAVLCHSLRVVYCEHCEVAMPIQWAAGPPVVGNFKANGVLGLPGMQLPNQAHNTLKVSLRPSGRRESQQAGCQQADC